MTDHRFSAFRQTTRLAALALALFFLAGPPAAHAGSLVIQSTGPDGEQTVMKKVYAQPTSKGTNQSGSTSGTSSSSSTASSQASAEEEAKARQTYEKVRRMWDDVTNQMDSVEKAFRNDPGLQP